MANALEMEKAREEPEERGSEDRRAERHTREREREGGGGEIGIAVDGH